MIVGDMDSVKDLEIEKVDVEVYITLHFSVSGKGSSYATSIDVNPNETLEIIRNRVSFFKMFSQRRYTLENVETHDVFEDSQFATLKFRDSGLKNNSRLVMKEPNRDARASNSAASEPAAEENEADRQQAVIFGEEGGLNFGEGGEDEMVEMEGGEDEMVESHEGGED
jgi:hypothetical protein